MRLTRIIKALYPNKRTQNPFDQQKLNKVFGERPFYYIEASSRLKISQKTLKRYLKPLILHGLTIQHKTKANTRAQFQIINASPIPDTSRRLFEDMQGEWKDFVGL